MNNAMWSMPSSRMRCGLFFIIAAVYPSCLLAASVDDLARRASWESPTVAATREKLFAWIDSQPIDAATRDQIEQQWNESAEFSPEQVLEELVTALASIDPRVKAMYDLCQRPRPAVEVPQVTVVDDSSFPSWVTANLRLFYGQWLTNQQLFDESFELISELQPKDVVDPAALLFYQSVNAHRRLEKELALTTLLKLLENEAVLPQRYAVVARLMQSDLAPLRPDSLDEISRLMDNITVRLGHGRAGQRVRQEESSVIEKLDKLIEQLEEQANAAGAGASGSGSSAPSSPMDDSMPGGGTGPGNVNPKELGTSTDWGNLPPKEREEALQQLSKDLPSHYRDVIEEYFRKLARERQSR